MTFQNKYSHPLVIINTHVAHMNVSFGGTPKGVMLQSNDRLTYLLLVRLPQSLLIPLLIHSGSSGFKKLVIPGTCRRGTAQGDAHINMYDSPQGGQPVWAEARHQGLARSQFGASYYPPESFLLPIRILFSDRIHLTLLAPQEGDIGWPACITARADRHACAHRYPATVHCSSTLESVPSNQNF